MKYSILIFCLIFLISCNRDKNYTVTNPLDEEIIDKTVILTRAEAMTFIEGISTNDILYAKSESGEWLPTQCDDLDGDGNWDELAFLCNLSAGQTMKISFGQPDTAPYFPQRTNVRFGRMTKPFEEVSGDLRMKTNETRFTAPVYQMEGPAWENDVIAFRNYYDARNGIDIFGKTTREMILDSVGVNGRDYHIQADWGMDILKVGNSLGAGAIAIGIGDSLYRIGPCEEGTYRMIAEGPVRAILELDYKNVPAGDRTYNVKHRIIINAGDRFYRNRVWVSNLKGDEILVTGIVNLHDVSADTLDNPNGKIMYSLGNQGFNGEVLGMAVFCPISMFINYDVAPVAGSGIVNTHLVKLKLYEDEPTRYRFMAVWEIENPLVKNRDHFLELINEAASR
jgi:hypothetical protein